MTMIVTAILCCGALAGFPPRANARLRGEQRYLSSGVATVTSHSPARRGRSNRRRRHGFKCYDRGIGSLSAMKPLLFFENVETIHIARRQYKFGLLKFFHYLVHR